jgi:expansin (peptidoglycan-binding protein)
MRTLAISLLLVCLGALACTADGEPGQTDGAAEGETGSGDGDGDTGELAPCDSPSTHAGEATYYDFADGSGNCSFPATPDDLLVGAMNAVDYAGSAVCGSCVRIEGPDGSVDVRIVDQCPECPEGDIDLSPQAFVEIAAIEQGRVEIEWTYVPCPVEGPVVYHFKDGSNQWWTAVQLRNHRHAIATFEVQEADAWVAVPRVDYNYFVKDTGMGTGPLSFRVTDVVGNVLEHSGIPLLDDADAPGSTQFPACEG